MDIHVDYTKDEYDRAQDIRQKRESKNKPSHNIDINIPISKEEITEAYKQALKEHGCKECVECKKVIDIDDIHCRHCNRIQPWNGA